jgi:type IV secretion system protein VirB8
MDEAARNYFAEAARWDDDRNTAVRQSARHAWLVATGACLVAISASVGLAMLTPLKRVEPFVVRVDSATGVVDVVPGYAPTATLPEVVTRHLVTEYVIQRERYVPAIAEADYEQIGALQSAPMNQRWAAAWARSNPLSPLNRYADGSRVRVQIKSVVFLKQVPGEAQTLQVRFLTATERGAGAAEEFAHFVATLETAYVVPSDDVRLRVLNPLGFKVLEYRREPEVSGAESDAPARVVEGSGAAP